MDAISAYIELGLRLGRHVDGLVDAYYGPHESAARIASETPRAPARLADDAAELRDRLTGALDAGRARWVAAQLTGLETVARRLAGEDIAFADEVERCYGIRPRRVPDDVFKSAHEALDALLPGDGPLSARYQAWREADALDGERLQRVVGALGDELRIRTRAAIGLPDAESVVFDYVRDEPWTAYNYYEGNLRSRVAVNTDLPMPANFVVELVAHETYPGHHTEHAWKEQRLTRERGQLEETLLMIGTPQSLISEGIAQVGPAVLLGDELESLGAEQLAREGLHYDAALARAIKSARRPLEDVPGNAALMLHEDGADVEAARQYLIRWGLLAEARAGHVIKFITDPVWRSYVSTYTDGQRLVESFVDGDVERLRRLLTEQLSPADLLERE